MVTRLPAERIPKLLMAELFGKYTGTSKGKGGSMHFFDAQEKYARRTCDCRSPGAAWNGNSVQGKYSKEDRVCLTFIGDAAMNQGAFHEVA